VSTIVADIRQRGMAEDGIDGLRRRLAEVEAENAELRRGGTAAGTAPDAARVVEEITTERRTAELRLALSEESLRLSNEAAEIGTWDLDLTTDVLDWSDRTKASRANPAGRCRSTPKSETAR